MGLAPKCGECGHSKRDHECGTIPKVCGLGHMCERCLSCPGYQPKRLTRVRVSAPKRKARTRILPRCKHCAHQHSRHVMSEPILGPRRCARCLTCPGYEPARGIRQKRRTPAAAIKRMADALWSQVVKLQQQCELRIVYPHECKAPLEAMHMIPRTFAATRWLPINGVCGCSAAHLYFTKRPELWSATCLDLWGSEVFRNLWATARKMQPVDLEATVAALRDELSKVTE